MNFKVKIYLPLIRFIIKIMITTEINPPKKKKKNIICAAKLNIYKDFENNLVTTYVLLSQYE